MPVLFFLQNTQGYVCDHPSHVYDGNMFNMIGICRVRQDAAPPRGQRVAKLLLDHLASCLALLAPMQMAQALVACKPWIPDLVYLLELLGTSLRWQLRTCARVAAHLNYLTPAYVPLLGTAF